MAKTLRIKNLAPAERPREKLQQKGAAALSDFELLELVVGKGNGRVDVGFIARKVQQQLRKGIAAVNQETLMDIKGVNVATSAQILAAFELARRYLVRESEPLTSMHDIMMRLDDIRDKRQEYLVCLSLDGGQRLIAQRTITIGILNAVMAHPREVFADALTDRAASVLIAHNHPSGNAMPTQQDIAFTQQLVAAGRILGITVRDHLIITKTDYFSFEQHHML